MLKYCFFFIIYGVMVLYGKGNIVNLIIENTEPVEIKVKERFPLFVWIKMLENLSEEELKDYFTKLKERNIVIFTGWREGKEKEAVRIDKIRQNMGIPVAIDATGIVYGFFDGSPETAHIDENGNIFFDTSFSKRVKIGCPFKVEKNFPVIRERIEKFLKEYKENGIKIDLWAVDWEIDGPMEWNDAWENSKKCVVCRKNIKNIDDFTEFQRVIRKIRAEIQNKVFVQTVKKYYPDCLIGNYGVNPHDGYRYWWDYFEREVEGAVYKRKHNALIRKWFDEFKYSGYTMAMPVIYTWYRFFNDYKFEEKEYRWFYPLMKEATSVGKNTPENIPVIAFVHWQTVLKPKEVEKDFLPLSREKYKELLWHLLLRGHDSFCLWSPYSEMAEEIKVVHEVYKESLKYSDFILKGEILFWDVPEEEPAYVISGVKFKNKLLVVKSNFGKGKEIEVKIKGKKVKIPPSSGVFILDF